ncbi:MAG: hypothetical protein JRI68_26515, partial [Deltaproteobacteria bacterium]|nr:hypothetical protein [Deltaproteobacteria bacterium]
MPAPESSSTRPTERSAPGTGRKRLGDWLGEHRREVAATGACTAVCVGFGAYRFDNFPLDDAYIHLSYGKYFQLGNLL